MPFHEYTWVASTYRPIELGIVEYQILDLFANEPNHSVYSIYKTFKESTNSGIRGHSKAISYKNIHKRVKRLSRLQLIEGVEGNFERGAKYYRISPYGLINYIARTISELSEFIVHNTDNTVIRSLLMEHFEEETIESFYTLKDHPTTNIRDYLHDCCSITTTICKNSWNQINQYGLEDILPDDSIIQKYMSYLDGKPMGRSVFDKIEEYRKRLEIKLNDINNKESERLAAAVKSYDTWYFREQGSFHYNRNIADEKPPFPLMSIYNNIVLQLEFTLEEKVKLLTFDLVSELGETIHIIESKNQEKGRDRRIENKEQLEELLETWGRDYSLNYVLKDKKFIEKLTSIKKDFDRGYKQFLYYH